MSHIQFYSGSNQWIADVDNLQNYLDIVVKKETSLCEFASLDTELNGISQSHELKNTQLAARNSNMTTGNLDNGAVNPANLDYLEPGYFKAGPVGDGAGGGDVEYRVQVPLKFIKNTIFSVNKDFYFGQTTYLKMYFGSINKVCYSSSVGAANPNAGVKVVYPNAGSITNLQLMLAVESNQNLRQDIISRVNSAGISYQIPYVQAFKNSNNGGSQNISIQLDQGNGRTLMKVYHAPYNSQESLNTMYDHCNVLLNTPQKTIIYYTQLNGKRTQDINLNCDPSANPPLLDYMSHRRQLRGTVLQNSNIYQYNWFHCDDFCDFDIDYTQNAESELLAGIPMTTAPLTWSFIGVTMADRVYFHYTWCVFLKKLTMTPGTVTVQ